MSLRSSLGYRIGSTSKCQIKPSHPGKRRVLLATGGARHSHTDTHKPPSSALQFEGRQEQGLRMLLFGKPGSGKVSPCPPPSPQKLAADKGVGNSERKVS